MAVRTELRVDTERGEIETCDGVRRQVGEAALAALCLLSLGYAPGDLAPFLGDGAEAALDGLRDAGWDESADVTLLGTVFFRHGDPPGARHLSGHLARRARHEPDALALLVEDPDSPDAEPFRVTAAEFHDFVAAIAGRLAGEGLGPGTHIAVDARPSLESVLLCVAAWQAGVSVAIVRDNLSASVLGTLQAWVGPRIWFGDFADRIPAGALYVPFAASDGDDFEAWVAGGAAAALPAPDPAREAVVLPSSGSTGVPKFIALSHRSLFASAHIARAGSPDIALPRLTSVTDLNAMSGLRTLAVMPALGFGCSVLMSEATRNSGLGCLLALARHRVTHAQAIPATLRAAVGLGAARYSELKLQDLVQIASGTGVLHQDLRDNFAALHPGVLQDSFGMNETAGTFSWARDGSVGVVGAQAHNTLVRVVDGEGAPCRPGETGCLSVFGENLFSGLYKATGFAPQPPGWYTTGDLGRRLHDGRFSVVGRAHDLIKTLEGEFLSPVAVEDAVMALDTIEEAVVVVLPATEEGERYAIAATRRGVVPAAEEAVRACITGQFGDFAAPARVLILDDLPRAAHGKPDRARLKALSLRDG